MTPPPNRIRELRLARNLSLAAVARRVAVDPTMLSRLESGERTLTQLYLEKIAEALGVFPAELLPGAGREVADEVVQSVEELKVLTWWRRMTRAQKFAVIAFAQGLGTPVSVTVNPIETPPRRSPRVKQQA